MRASTGPAIHKGHVVIKCTLSSAGALALVLVATASEGAMSGTVGSDPKQVISGNLVTPPGVLAGELLSEGDRMTCVAGTCADPPGGRFRRRSGPHDRG